MIPPSQNKGMDYKEYTEAKRGTSWKQKLKQTIDRLVITAKDYDDFLRLMQEAGYEIKTGKYISFRAEGQERFTRSKTIGENYTEERIKERIAGRTPRRSQRQTVPNGISLIGDIQERIRLIDSKGYEYKAKLTILKEAARTLNYLTENKAICIDQAGSIAEASLQLNGIFQAAERACQQYTENIVRLSQHQQVICAQREKESQEKALQIVADAQKQAEDATTAAQKQCDEMLKKAKAESQAYWDAVSAKITSITNEHAELRQLFSQISAREKDKQL